MTIEAQLETISHPRHRFVNTLPLSTAATTGAPERIAARTSDVLRGILSKNPGVKRFSVERILQSIGSERLEASLMMFAIPAIIPVPAPRGMVAVPTGAIAYRLAVGQRQIELPACILAKSVTRKALAVAIHGILPVLEAAETLVHPRWHWVNHAISRRMIGLFVFLLALAIAYPFCGFNALHATCIFVISLGMAEHDGLTVLVGVLAGVLSLAMVASGASVRAIRETVVKALHKIARKLGLQLLARALAQRGYTRLARLLTLEWSTLLLRWDPERPRMARARPAQSPFERRRAALRGRRRALAVSAMELRTTLSGSVRRSAVACAGSEPGNSVTIAG